MKRHHHLNQESLLRFHLLVSANLSDAFRVYHWMFILPRLQSPRMIVASAPSHAPKRANLPSSSVALNAAAPMFSQKLPLVSRISGVPFNQQASFIAPT
jgi:hypothetical protein